MSRLNTTAALVTLLGALCFESLLGAQPGPSGGSTPPAPTPDAFPRVRLIYYVSAEGVRKEIRYAALTEWTIGKDVYIDLVPNREVAQGFAPAPDTDARLAPDFKFSRPPSHIWKVRYEPATTEGQSRLFVRGFDGRTSRARIYSAQDVVIFHYIGGTGWHELGAEARVARYLMNRLPASNPQLPTRSQ